MIMKESLMEEANCGRVELRYSPPLTFGAQYYLLLTGNIVQLEWSVVNWATMHTVRSTSHFVSGKL